MCQKIYIIGPVGSGKTTLAKNMAYKWNIKNYELDKIVWNDEKGNVKRSPEEIDSLFLEILKKPSWIIEDVGRQRFIEGIKQADIVYYIDLPPIIIYKRLITRCVKQKLGLEPYNYKPTLRGLIEFFGWAKKDIKTKNKKIAEIKKYAKQFEILSYSSWNNWKDS